MLSNKKIVCPKNLIDVAKKEAILLDPVYSGKAFAGLIGLIKNKKFTKKDNVLFIHTGGAASLSAYEWAF